MQKTSCNIVRLIIFCAGEKNEFEDSGACTFFRGVPHPHLLGVQLLNLIFTVVHFSPFQIS
jgi:hypothetical protein